MRAMESLILSRPKGRFIDIYDSMLQNGKVRPELYLEDELHMNRKGYKIWKEVVKKHLDTKGNSNGRN